MRVLAAVALAGASQLDGWLQLVAVRRACVVDGLGLSAEIDAIQESSLGLGLIVGVRGLRRAGGGVFSHDCGGEGVRFLAL